jgi:hypothetical protein
VTEELSASPLGVAVGGFGYLGPAVVADDAQKVNAQ